MSRLGKSAAKQRALAAVKEYGVGLTLFRHAMSEFAGLNPTDMECLRFLFLNGVATPSVLARQTGLTSGATTAMLDRLQRAGLVERGPNPDDRRGALVTPAASASARMAGWFESARKAQDALLSAYSAAELETIADAFERFARLWDEERAKLRANR